MLLTENCREKLLYLVLEQSERSNTVKIDHIIDIEKLFGIDSLNNFIGNTSF